MDDDLPAYGPPGPDEYVSTLESLETEEDEGIGMEPTEPFHTLLYKEPTWSFSEPEGVNHYTGEHRYCVTDIGRGDKSIDTWRDMPVSWRRTSDSSMAAIPSSPSENHDPGELDDDPIHFVEASDDPGTTNGFAGLAGERAQDTTPVDEIEPDMLEDDLRKGDDDGGDTKMD